MGPPAVAGSGGGGSSQEQQQQEQRRQHQQQQKHRMYSVIVPGTETPTTTAVRRAPETPDRLVERVPGHEDIATLAQAFAYAAATYPNMPHLGHRALNSLGESEYVWETYSQVHARAVNFGRALSAKGLIPVIDGMRTLAILSKNRAEWVIGEQALLMQGGTVVPLYDSLGAEAIRYVFKQTELTTVLCSREELTRVIRCAKECPSLQDVVMMDEPNEKEHAEASAQGLVLHGFAELEQFGAGTSDASVGEPLSITEDSAATFCYTSGTTGLPKGAVLTHKNMLSALASVVVRGITVTPHDVHLSYLPLAHVFERQVQYLLMLGGGRCGFFSGAVQLLASDMRLLRPTLFFSVPRVLNKLYTAVVAGANESYLKGMVLRGGLRGKIAAIRAGRNQPHWLWDKLVFQKIAQKVGLDRCWIIITASAPIRDDVKFFLRAVCNCLVVEGYGQSETGAAGASTCLCDTSNFNVGSPSASVELMLEAVPDLGYLPTDTMHMDGATSVPCQGRGEVCIRGPAVLKEYYKMPKETSETVDANGWCHTGDIGIWLPTGQLRIVDRKKNMFKLSQGEYVASERVETAYIENAGVQQIFVYGDSLQSFLVAVVVPDFLFLAKEILLSLGLLTDMAPADVCANKKVADALLKRLQATGVSSGLRGFEQVKAIILTPDAFTVENGLLTPTFKLRRAEIKAAFAPAIAAAYEALGDTPAPRP